MAESGEVDRWFERYIETFFSGDALLAVLVYMCNSCTMEISDPVCNTLLMFIRNPVSFTVTDVGLLPFRNSSMAIFPFAAMSTEQKQFLIEYIAFIRGGPFGDAQVQMGGGSVLSLQRGVAKIYHIDVVEVLSRFFGAILGTDSYAPLATRRSICNIILQRLGAAVHLSRDNIARVHKAVLKFSEERETPVGEASHADERHGGAVAGGETATGDQ